MTIFIPTIDEIEPKGEFALVGDITGIRLLLSP